MEKAIILLSGGLDSATCSAIAKKQGYDCYGMSFRYGQKHHFEITAAKKIAKHMGFLEHKIVEIDLSTFGGSSLTTASKVPKNRSFTQENKQSIPNTYVPARNTIFLSYALAWGEVLPCRHIFIGVNAIDYSGYPDCRPAFIKSFEEMANLATKAGVEGMAFTIHAPLITKTKADIIKIGVSLGVDYGQTISCYDPPRNGFACGKCDSCLLRKKGFREAEVPDPTVYFSE